MDDEKKLSKLLDTKYGRWLLRTLVVLGLAMLAAIIILGSVLLYFNSSLPPIDKLANYHPPQVTRLLDRKGRLVGQLFDERRTVVAFEQIPEFVRQAFLAAEDADFYQHQGLDFSGLARAFWANLRAGRVVQGGSTITQQVIKTFLLGPQRSYTRKIKELLLAFRLESNLSKDEILFLYLNQIYFGHGCYGILEASRYYFGKHVSELSLHQAAVLGSLPKSPTRYSPVWHPERALARRNWVLSQMASDGMIEDEAAQLAKSKPLGIVAQTADYFQIAPYYAEHCRKLLVEWFGRDVVYRGGLQVDLAVDIDQQQAARRAVRWGLRRVDQRHGFRGPLGKISDQNLSALHQQLGDIAPDHVWSLQPLQADGPAAESDQKFKALRHKIAPDLHLVVPVVAILGSGKEALAKLDLGSTTVDLDYQNISWARPFSPVRDTPAPSSVSDILQVGDVVQVTITRVAAQTIQVALSQPPLVQGALVAIEPGSRQVVALIGGSDFVRSPLIRAVQSRRQPGSAMKPIVYAAALEAQAITPASIRVDSPEVYRLSGGRAWKPSNHSRVFSGPVSIRTALARSINTIAVKITSEIGVSSVIDMAHRLGIESELSHNLTLALGSSEVTPLELTNAYTTFATSGVYAKPVFITRVSKSNGEPMELPNTPQAEQVIDPAYAYLVTSLMRSVVEEGTGRKALALQRPVVGKTGTANQQRDGWFVGYSPDLACGVWVGFDDHSRMGSGWASGSGTALPIWVEFMKVALAEKPITEFKVPADVVHVRIDPENGLLARPNMPGSRFEVFAQGTEPRSYSTRVATESDTTIRTTEVERLPDGFFQ